MSLFGVAESPARFSWGRVLNVFAGVVISRLVVNGGAAAATPETGVNP
jgi:hypothetical protein